MSAHPSTDNPDVHHEESDVDIATILKFGGALAILATAVFVIIWGLLSVLERRQSDTTVDFPMAAGETRLPPGPQLQVAPRDDLRMFLADEADQLSTYGWVDRDLGRVRIPIDVAKRLTIERGLPSRSQKASAPAGAPQP